MGSCAFQGISGWGRFPVEKCHVYRPEKGREVAPLIASGPEKNYIVRGLGRSYGDASINGGCGVLDYSRLNRMLDFDPATGLLECEAGVSLAEILEAFVPKGFFPSVLPGTKYVTVGGAIANDVHGKNHHQDGAFSMFVEDFRLLKADGEIVTCSKGQNSDIFWATAGGIGLTGVILSARLRLQPIQSAYVLVDYLRTTGIEQTLEAIRESDVNYKYSVAWVDCLAKGAQLGRCVLMRGNHAPPDALPTPSQSLFHVKPKRQLGVPIEFPGFVLNALSIGAFNKLYYSAHPSHSNVILDYNSYFCPLDGIDNWNRMYGKRGFGQYQATFPMDHSQGLVQLLEKVSQSSRASFLAVLKRLGPGNAGLLSYPAEGYTITLDLPMRADLIPFMHELDRIVLDHGGRLYCAKDVSTLPETFAAMYPRLDEFREVKARLDPNNRFSSTMARRLRIVPA